MLMGITSEQLIWIVLSLLTSIPLLHAYSSNKARKNLLTEIARKEQALKTSSVSDILEELKISISTVEEKMANGKPIYQKLIESLKHLDQQLKYINADLLPPTFKFDDREALKNHIEQCRQAQLMVIENRNATTAFTDWEWFGSKQKGLSMVKAYRHLLLRAFNSEFDVIRKQMRHSTYDTAIKKLYRLEDQLEKLGETANVRISNEFFNLKGQELGVWHKELLYKEKIKQELKKQQALLRSQAKLAGGDTEDLEDDIYYRKSDLIKAQKIAKQLHGASALDMEAKINSMKNEIKKLESKFQRAESQAQLTKVGFIYVISNIGSFGEGVVKIGMTRRLEPMDRVNELGDASVPYKFDVHTLTFVDNAPKVEKELHHKFAKRRVNTDNYRKEFFRVSPQEVAAAMVEFNIDCDWYFDVEAKEYRESLLMRKAMKKEASSDSTIAHQLPASI